MRSRLLVPVLVLVALAVSGGRGVVGQSSPSRLTTVLVDLAAAVPQEFGPAAAATTRRTLDRAALAKPARDAIRSGRLRINDSQEVQVYLLLSEITDDVMRVLGESDVRIEIVDAPRRRVQARVPIARLHDVASLPYVRFVRVPSYAYRRRIGSTTTEGDAIVRAEETRKTLGLTGAGVRVGVISDGLKGLFAPVCRNCPGAAGGPIPLGDLPPATGRRSVFGRLLSSTGGVDGRAFHGDGDLEGLPPSDCAFGGAGAEGTALLEIVHDLAPGAELAFANADTDIAFMQAVNFLAANSDVVVDDLGFFGDAYDGTSGVSTNTAAALNAPGHRIRAYVTSVGNAADQHYFGTFVNSGVDGAAMGLGTTGNVHLFEPSGETTDILGVGPQPFNLIALPQRGQAIVFLSWDDPSGASANDYDLFLVRDDNGAVVARSTDRQSGEQDPLEVLDFTNDGPPGLFRIVIQNAGNGAQPRGLNLFTLQPQCAASGPQRLVGDRPERHNFNTATRSVSAQSDAGGSPVSVISVGAVWSGSADANAVFPTEAPHPSCLDQSHSTVEVFSSRGPTIDGRMKPEVVAIDGVSVTGAGGFPNPFFGTSAAAPHVAAQAALLLQASPCLAARALDARDPDDARARVRELILQTARPLPNADNAAGSGLVDVLASVTRTLPERVGPFALVVPGNTIGGAAITGEELGYVDPNECRVAFVRTPPGGPCLTGKAGTLACPFGTSDVVVETSSNGVAFSAANDIRVTVTDFAVTIGGGSATVDAGEPITRTVTVSPHGGPFAADVALSCAGLPPGATCTFSPPLVRPNAFDQISLVTIQTAGSSETPKEGRVFRPGLTPDLTPGLKTGDSVVTVGSVVVFALLAFIVLTARRLPARAAGVALVLLAAVACEQMQQPGDVEATLVPGSVDFDSQITQTTSAEQTVTITNEGTAPLQIRSIAASGDFGQTHLCGPIIAPRGVCPVRVQFTPTANGPRTGQLTVVTDAVNSPHVANLAGEGIAPSNGTPPGTYAITISGRSGQLARSSTLMLTVR